MAKWHKKYRVEWDATQQTVWAIVLEMERFTGKGKAEDQGALALVIWRRHLSGSVFPWSGLGNALQLPRKILRVLCGYLEHQRRVQFEGCPAEPLTTITAILPRSMWSCLLQQSVLQDAQNKVAKFLAFFVDDITALLRGKSKQGSGANGIPCYRAVMRYVCPQDAKKMLLQRARTVHWKKWAAKHDYEEWKEGIWLEPALALLRKKTKGDWTEMSSARAWGFSEMGSENLSQNRTYRCAPLRVT